MRCAMQLKRAVLRPARHRFRVAKCLTMPSCQRNSSSHWRRLAATPHPQLPFALPASQAQAPCSFGFSSPPKEVRRAQAAPPFDHPSFFLLTSSASSVSFKAFKRSVAMRYFAFCTLSPSQKFHLICFGVGQSPPEHAQDVQVFGLTTPGVLTHAS